MLQVAGAETFPNRICKFSAENQTDWGKDYGHYQGFCFPT